MNDVTKSPIIIKTRDTMSFVDAIREVIKGKRIHKKEWANRDFFALLKEDRLKIHKLNGKYHEWIISKEDLIGEDYIVL